MKKLIVILLAVSLLCASSAALAHDPWILQFASRGEPGSIIELTVSAFEGALVNNSDDTIELEIDYENQWGDVDAVVQELRGKKSAVALATLPDDTLLRLGCAPLAVLSSPFLFRNDAHLKAFLKTDTVQTLQAEVKNKKLSLDGISLLDGGFYGFALRQRADSLRGLRLAVPDEQYVAAMVRELGAEPVILEREAAVATLKAGEVDGMEVTLEQYDAYGLYDAAPCFFMDRHRVNFYLIVMSDDTWQMATRLEQGYLMLSGQYAIEFSTKFRSNREANYLKKLEEAGTVLVEAGDAAAWAAQCPETVNQARKDNGKLYQAIAGVKDE